MTTPTNREELIRLRAEAWHKSAYPNLHFQWRDSSQKGREPYLRCARATLEAEEAAGVVCVPIEPTAAMKDAGISPSLDAPDWAERRTTENYKKMLSSSPYTKESNMTTTKKLCIECANWDGNLSHPFCHRMKKQTSADNRFPVPGTWRVEACSYDRQWFSLLFGGCGPFGRFYQERKSQS